MEPVKAKMAQSTEKRSLYAMEPAGVDPFGQIFLALLGGRSVPHGGGGAGKATETGDPKQMDASKSGLSEGLPGWLLALLNGEAPFPGLPDGKACCPGQHSTSPSQTDTASSGAGAGERLSAGVPPGAPSGPREQPTSNSPEGVPRRSGAEAGLTPESAHAVPPAGSGPDLKVDLGSKAFALRGSLPTDSVKEGSAAEGKNGNSNGWREASVKAGEKEQPSDQVSSAPRRATEGDLRLPVAAAAFADGEGRVPRGGGRFSPPPLVVDAEGGQVVASRDEVNRSAVRGPRPAAERLWGYWIRRGSLPSDRSQPDGSPAKPPVNGAPSDAARAMTEILPPADLRQGVPSHREATDRPAATREAAGARTASAPEAAPPQGAIPRANVVQPAPAAKPQAYTLASPNGAEQVARSIRVSLSREGDRVTVHLEPASLGKVQVVVVREGSDLAAHFRVDTPQAQQALTADAPALRQALGAKGLCLGHISVDLGGSTEHREGNPGQGRRSGRRWAQRSAGEDSGNGAAPLTGWRPWAFDARA